MFEKLNLDDDYSIVSDLSRMIEKDQVIDRSWVDSPFEWLMRAPSATKGAVGKRLAASWAEARGIRVNSGTGTDGDRIMNGAKVQIRMSTPWENGPYKFQQIRDLDFDYLFCLGVSPHSVHAWLFPIHLLKQHVIGKLGQHTGKGASETSWIELGPSYQPAWARDYGSSLDRVFDLLSEHGNPA